MRRTRAARQTRSTATNEATNEASSAEEAAGESAPASRKRVRITRRQRGKRPASSGQSREAEARAAWASGARSAKQMRLATGMGRTAAAGWVRTFKAEQAQLSLVADVAAQERA
jgi:hypothetical protein